MIKTMIKDKYSTLVEDVSTCRGVLHLLTFWIWLTCNQPILAASYFISFCYHALPFGEVYFKFLDYWLIILRVVFFDYTPHGVQWPLALTSGNVHIVGIVLCCIGLMFPFIGYTHMRLYTLFCVIIMIGLHIWEGTLFNNLHTALYTIPGTLYYKSMAMSWHNKHWTWHEDFHLVLFIIDMFVKYRS